MVVGDWIGADNYAADGTTQIIETVGVAGYHVGGIFVLSQPLAVKAIYAAIREVDASFVASVDGGGPANHWPSDLGDALERHGVQVTFFGETDKFLSSLAAEYADQT